MDKRRLIEEAERFMRKNVPKSRQTKEGSGELYFDHVLGARKYALRLAKIYNADKFIVEMASLLHDIGADAGKIHAYKSAKIARKFLSKFEISEKIKEKIIKCIETHSTGSKTETIEQQIIQDADGIVFIEDSYKTYFEKEKQRFSLKEARKLSKEKTKRMMDKIKTKEGIKLAKQFLKKSLQYLETAN